MKRTAVITDAVSAQFYFPLWYEYYGSQFGHSNLFVVTYDGMRGEFRSLALGGVWEAKTYNNDKRIGLISGLIDVLLTQYDYVIRVDTDEFLVPDVRAHASLAAYMEALERPYVTAEGYDIVPRSEDGPLDVKSPVLIAQRTMAYPYDALYKTCVTSMPLKWAPGFHFCSEFPGFHQLFLFHLKRSDLNMQMEIGEAIAARAPGERNRDYYLTKRETLSSYNNAVLQFPLAEGWEGFIRLDYRTKFMQGIKYTKSYGGVYHGGAFRPEKALVKIPIDFEGIF